jgi:threonine synthase
VIDFAGSPLLAVETIRGDGIGRYSRWLGIESLLSLGEVRTPLVTLGAAHNALVKNEGLQPTGSFKDRGAATLMTWLGARAVQRVVADSSGNAGAAIAAYATRAGIECEVHVPALASITKVRQIEAYGARVVRHDGPRSVSTIAAQRATTSAGAVYASQLWHPAFLLGIETVAFELWEQCEVPPDAVVMPVGAGTLLLGVARGFERLRLAGLVDRTPRLFGIQVANCTPIASRFGFDPDRDPGGESIAEGIQITAPPRAPQVIRAIQSSGGTALVAPEADIAATLRASAREGLLVEPTAAVGIAGVAIARERGLLAPDDRVIVIATGSGLKAIESNYGSGSSTVLTSVKREPARDKEGVYGT